MLNVASYTALHLPEMAATRLDSIDERARGGGAVEEIRTCRPAASTVYLPSSTVSRFTSRQRPISWFRSFSITRARTSSFRAAANAGSTDIIARSPLPVWWCGASRERRGPAPGEHTVLRTRERSFAPRRDGSRTPESPRLDVGASRVATWTARHRVRSHALPVVVYDECSRPVNFARHGRSRTT